MVAAGMPVVVRMASSRGVGARALGATLGVLLSALSLAAVSSSAAAAGFPPSEQVLPATTRAWVSAPDAAALRERFDRSALGKLFDEPLMQKFYDALDEQRSSIAGDRMGIGITPKELSTVSGGESAVAAVEQADGSLAGLLLVDTSGHDDAVPALLETVFKRLIDRGGKKLPAPEGISSFELPPLPPREGQPAAAEPAAPRRIAYASRPGALVAGTNAEIRSCVLGKRAPVLLMHESGPQSENEVLGGMHTSADPIAAVRIDPGVAIHVVGIRSTPLGHQIVLTHEERLCRIGMFERPSQPAQNLVGQMSKPLDPIRLRNRKRSRQKFLAHRFEPPTELSPCLQFDRIARAGIISQLSSDIASHQVNS